MPSYTVKTFGCQMNVHDSERIEETLRAAGYRASAEPDGADLIVINTCSVREKAEQKLRSLVGTLAPLKASRPDIVIAVAGCVAQQEGEKLLSRMRQVDLVVGPDNIAELPQLVAAVQGGSPPIARTVFDIDEPVFLRAAADPRGVGPTAFVTVMKGCDERCSFCIVPHTRGPERYRASGEVVDEIRRLVDSGVREVTLLGQTVNSYRDPQRTLEAAPLSDVNDADESEFPALLRRIAQAVPGLSRLRYTSPHPRHVTPSLVAAHRELDVLARHVHLPVQSGSNRVLKRMIRRYTKEEYVERAERLMSARPGLTLSTDIIVGFPGETDDDFQQTLELVKSVAFSGLFGFKYSRRPYTPAQKLSDDIPESAKSERLGALFALAEELQREKLAALVGSRQKVLVEGVSKAGSGRVTGRTERNEIVHLADEREISLVGELVEVRIVRAFKHSLEGELSDAERARASSGRPPRRALPIFSGEA
ncbi:MAG TPA: tRNA (N6-isopentenyl adenosine(37)-C2)-methylthiotransferase MiaB [Polyangiaceae bacterium]